MKEIQHLGINAETVSSFGIIFFTLIGLVGQIRQAALIWKKPKNGPRSAQSVSAIWIVTTMYMFVGYASQGFIEDKSVMFWSALSRIVLYIPILAGVATFGTFSRQAKRLMVAGSITILPLSVGGIWCSVFMSTLALIAVGGVCWQAVTIKRNRSAGKVSVFMLATFAGSTACWTWYAALFKLWALCVLSAVFLAVYIITIVLWFIYRPSKTVPTSRES